MSPQFLNKIWCNFPFCGHYKHIPLHSSTDGCSSLHDNIAEHVHVLCCYNWVCCLRLFKQSSYAIFVPVFIYFYLPSTIFLFPCQIIIYVQVQERALQVNKYTCICMYVVGCSIILIPESSTLYLWTGSCKYQFHLKSSQHTWSPILFISHTLIHIWCKKKQDDISWLLGISFTMETERIDLKNANHSYFKVT